VLAGGVFGSPTAALAQGTTVVVIDIGYIFKNHVRFKEAKDAMKKEVDQYEEQIRSEREAITKMAEQLKALQPDSPDYKGLEEQIAQRTGKLQLESQRARKDILQREAKLLYDTYQEVTNHVATFARQNNISLVLRFSSEPIESDDGAAVFQGIQRELNITPHILRQVNGGAAPPPTTTGPINSPQPGPAGLAPQGRQAFGPPGGQPR
jgi:Skp family chaperone for outer membrane proteins